MILKDGTKHACRSCITGHRSSKCVHHDRELFPIAKKGRPSTQCKACKQRGTPGGRCECQLKRKPKSKADDLAGDGFGQSSGYAPEGSNSRKDSGGSQISNYPTPEDGTYSRMMSFPSALDGTSTRATNSSASSPSYTQQSFAIHHAPLDSHAVVAAGLPFPQPDTHFAYGIHHDTHGHGQTGLPELPPPRSNPSAGRSRPTTAGEEDVPWWLYRAGYSPNTGIPYEPPGDGPAPGNGPAALYPDYGHYLAQPSPYNLGTPGAPPQASPAFVWHNNATSYRDYMANQQVGNYQPSSSQTAPAYHHHHRAAEQHNQHPGLSHHHSLPYLPAHTSTGGDSTAPHSAPAPLSSIPQQHFSHRQRPPHDPSWASMSMESSNSGHYVVSSTGHDRRPSDQVQHGHPTTNKSRAEEVPALAYDSGASPLASTESLLSMNNSTMPFHLGYMPPAQYKTDHQYDSRPNSQSNLQSPDAALRERRSTSFDQVASRASPINLKLPEDRKKRKLELDV